MATRRAIREAFVSELQTAVPSSGSDGHVPDASIQVERPESTEDLPAVVYDDAYRRVPINEASGAPRRINRDVNGDATGEVYATLREARFSALLWFVDEDEKEACYEAVLDHFERYEQPAWDASSIHSHVEWVRARDANSEDNSEANPSRRGDRLLISFVYLREQENTGDAIQQVDHDVDADNDGSTDLTWSST